MRGIIRGAVAVGGLVVMAMVSSCSGSGTSGAPSLSADEASDWFGRAGELVLGCEVSSEAAGVATWAHAAEIDGSDFSIPTVMAAGQAVEECLGTLDETHDQQWSDLLTQAPALAISLHGRVEALLAVDQAVLLAAANNFDNRAIVGDLFEKARAADAAATDLEQLVGSTAASFGVSLPDGPSLYRWNPPDH